MKTPIFRLSTGDLLSNSLSLKLINLILSDIVLCMDGYLILKVRITAIHIGRYVNLTCGYRVPSILI